MVFSLFVKRKMLRVLNSVDLGVLTTAEIAEHSKLSASSVEAPLYQLESRGLVASGLLLPAELRIYRTTELGKQALASRSIP